MTGAIKKAVHLRIEGLVQGVFFRVWTSRNAIEMNLDGWVRNRRDGTVEAVFRGPLAAVDQMVDACRRGAPGAVVRKVDVQPWTEDVATGFKKLQTR